MTEQDRLIIMHFIWFFPTGGILGYLVATLNQRARLQYEEKKQLFKRIIERRNRKTQLAREFEVMRTMSK